MIKPKHISLLLLTKNESTNIQKHFNWLTNCPVINEIVAVDDNSIDATINALKSLETKNLKIKIYTRSLYCDFAAQRNWGIGKTKNNWVLWLDADEQPSPEMQSFLNNFTFNKKLAYAFKRDDIFLGKHLKYGETAYIYFTRLFNKTRGKFYRPVHEIWQTQQPINYKEASILHYSHNTLRSFLEKINFYSDIRAQELFKNNIPTNLFEIIFYPFSKFIQNYIFKAGFLDSTPGIIMALCMSLHSFLVRAKLWHLYQK